MSEAPITETDLQAYADGRLEPKRRMAVEAWLAAHPEEAERIDDYRRIAKELRTIYDPVAAEPLPSQFVRARPRWRRYVLAAGWMVVAFLAGVLAGWELQSRSTPVADAGAAMARRAAIAHVTYSPEVRHPVEVGADQEAHLIAWLSKRLGAPLRVPQLEEVGYSLVGGRLLPGDTGPVADFMYQTQKGARITLYVRTEVAGNRETAFRYAEEGKVRVFYWVDRKMGYAVSSGDISKDELLKVANSVYQQLNP
ncbi:MAG TPA: anti-sigma factor [Burkholderiales bacterium]|jgi:anti-sigma factor RsiW